LACRSQSNGSIVFSHRILIEYLKQWLQKHDWDKYATHTSIQYMKAYNTNVHERMKYMPHELVFGRAARVPTSSTSLDDKRNESYSEYATYSITIHYSIEYSTVKHHHARTWNMQKLDVTDTMTVKQIRKYLTRTIMYIC